MSNTIGDYYERKDEERKAAYKKWIEAIQRYSANPSYANLVAMEKAKEATIDAGNTGD